MGAGHPPLGLRSPNTWQLSSHLVSFSVIAILILSKSYSYISPFNTCGVYAIKIRALREILLIRYIYIT